MRILTLLAISALSITAASPAFAQDSMMKGNMKSDKMAKMSAADTKKMKMCQAMPHDKMAKNADCKRLMKTHPDMMKSNSMSKGNMMSQGH